MILNSLSFYILLSVLLITAVITDLKFRKIPNMLTLPSIGIAIIYYSLANGIEGFLFSIEGVGVGVAVFILFYIMGGMGAGDVKLMGAVGGFLGPKGVFIAFLCSAIIGGIYALATLIFHGHIAVTMKRYAMTLKTYILTRKIIFTPSSEEVKKLRLCYGVAIALGTMFSLYWEF